MAHSFTFNDAEKGRRDSERKAELEASIAEEKDADKRLEEQRKLFGLAVVYDFGKVNINDLVDVWFEPPSNLHVRVSPLIGELVAQELIRFIDLVYQEQ